MNHFVGIDAGANTGVAIWTPSKKRLDLFLTDFWGVFPTVEEYELDLSVDNTKIVIEMPGQFLYNRNDTHGKKVSVNIAAKVGGVRREAELLALRFQELGFAVDRPQPRRQKVNAAHFESITKYYGQTNEHTRDAGMLVYGMK